ENHLVIPGDKNRIDVRRARPVKLEQHTRRIKQRAQQHEDDKKKNHPDHRGRVQRPAKNARLARESHTERNSASGGAETMLRISLEICSMSRTMVFTLPTR